eukprot:scaffold28266_cov24-Tisochrysis_lutea.AAC.2
MDAASEHAPWQHKGHLVLSFTWGSVWLRAVSDCSATTVSGPESLDSRTCTCRQMRACMRRLDCYRRGRGFILAADHGVLQSQGGGRSGHVCAHCGHCTQDGVVQLHGVGLTTCGHHQKVCRVPRQASAHNSPAWGWHL